MKIDYDIVQQAITNPVRVFNAFTWRDTLQGVNFWAEYAAGTNTKKGKVALQEMLDTKETNNEVC